MHVEHLWGVLTGADGSAGVTLTSPSTRAGRVMLVTGLFKDNGGTAVPATTDVTVQTVGDTGNAGGAPPRQTLFQRSNSAAAFTAQPKVQNYDTASPSALIAAEYGELVISDQIQVVVAQGNTNNRVDVWVVIEED